MKESDSRMRRKTVALSMLAGLIVSFGIGAYVGAATSNSEPGSVGDPIITKSYLEERLAQSKNENNSTNMTNIENEIVALKEQISALQQSNTELKQQLSTSKKETTQSNFKKVTVKKGKTLIMKYGTEMIFYSGQGKFKSANNKYILDLTERNHVTSGSDALLYHNYLIRSGCNLEATKDIVVYIQGTYSIK